MGSPIARTASASAHARTHRVNKPASPSSMRLGLPGETEHTFARPRPRGAKAGGHPREKMDGAQLRNVM